MGHFRRFSGGAILVAALVGLSGCGGVRDTLGLGPLTPPDEFAVVTKAPLVLPPDFGLRPPNPGAPRPTAPQPADAAAALFAGGGGEAAAGQTPGENALLAAAGAAAADPDIRATIQLEAEQIAARGRPFAERVLFWQAEAGPDAPLNAAAEAERLRQAGVAGLPPAQPAARRAGGLLAF